MFKKLCVLVFIMGSLQATAQIILTGQLISNDSVSGLHIINKTSLQYAISSESGVFEIPVQLNDTLSIVSLQYKEKQVVVSNQVYKTKTIKIMLEEAINTLDEVVVGSSLTGNLKEDVSQVPQVDLPNLSFSWAQIKNAKFKDDRHALRNIITTKGQFVDGVNFVQIFNTLAKAIIKKDKKSKNANSNKNTLSVTKIKSYFGDEFFQETLHITTEQEVLFLQYCENNPIIKESLVQENQLKLLELLRLESFKFKALPNEE